MKNYKKVIRVLSLFVLSLWASTNGTIASADYLPTVTTYTSRLENEVQKMIDVGHLRTSYTLAHNRIHLNQAYTDKTTLATVNQFDDLFHNPADTMYTLSISFPHLSDELKTQVLQYIESYYGCNPTNSPQYSVCSITHIGVDGKFREVHGIPEPEILSLTNTGITGYNLSNGPQEPNWEGWSFNPFNYYALYRYAGITSNSQEAAQLIIDRLQQVNRPKPGSLPSDDFLRTRPHVLNVYIAGYYGYLGLLSLNNQPPDSHIQNQLNSALNKRVSFLPRLVSLSPTPYPTTDPRYPYEFPDPPEIEVLNLSTLEAGGFLWLVPELGDYLYANAYEDVLWAVETYESTKPYWSVPRVDEAMRILPSYNEGTISHLYDVSSPFLARAYALKQSSSQLDLYLDSPAYPVGDLFYIQNLVAAIEAPTDGSPTPTPNPADRNADGVVNIFDLNHVISQFTSLGYSVYQSVITFFGKVL